MLPMGWRTSISARVCIVDSGVHDMAPVRSAMACLDKDRFASTSFLGMSEPPRTPCTVRGLRGGIITDTACLEKILSYGLWMGEAHTPLSCVAYALAQWHTSERVSFLMSRLCTPTQLRAKYQEVAYDRVVAILDDKVVEGTVDEAMRAAVRLGPLAQAAVHEAERESHVRAFLAAIYRREYVSLLTQRRDATFTLVCVVALRA